MRHLRRTVANLVSLFSLISGTIAVWLLPYPWSIIIGILLSACTGFFIGIMFEGGKQSKPKPDVLLLNHRSQTRKWYEETLAGKDDVFIISIMSDNSLGDIQHSFDQGRIQADSIHVLTLSPDISDDILRSLTKQLKENFEEKKAQLKSAWEKWQELQRKSQGRIKAYTYSTIPTLQGVLREGKAINIELLTFETTTHRRASLFIDAKRDPEAFAFFVGRFKALWEKAEKEAANNSPVTMNIRHIDQKSLINTQ